MGEKKWGWHGLDICLDLFQRSNSKGIAWSEHSHDFYEVFWIEEGYCLHRLNGIETVLSKGDIIFLNPGDIHGGTVVIDGMLVHTNLSLEKSTLERIREHYSIKAEHWPWNFKNNRRFTLSPKQMMILKNLKENLDYKSELDHDLFVLQLLKFMKEPLENNLVSLPKWLQESLRTLHIKRQYSHGVSGLARISGYSREHISRIIRTQLNKSSTELLGDLRFEGVSNLLLHTDLSILDIADEYDFISTAYFYKCFKTRYGKTPKKFRESYRNLLIEKDS